MTTCCTTLIEIAQPLAGSEHVFCLSEGTAVSISITISAPTGTSQLPIVELDETHVKADRKAIRARKNSSKLAKLDCSFGDFSETLEIDAWRFFHAAKKTEFTTSFTRPFIKERAMLFAHEYRDYFVWNTANLRRTDRSVIASEDFFSSALAGRFGEATAYLAMLSLGYVYWDRIGVLADRALRRSDMTHAERLRRGRGIRSRLKVARPDIAPDFAFENTQGQVALMESKGSVVHPASDRPTVKSDLKYALQQIEAWSGMIRPMPQKYYAIGTYFREASDTCGDPSLIALVDPPAAPDSSIEPVEFPPDWIRRGNYGAWLRGMGLTDAGERLANAERGTGRIFQLPVVPVGPHQFVLLPTGGVEHNGTSSPQRLPFNDMLEDGIPFYLHPLDYWYMTPALSPASFGPLFVGLEVGIMHRVARTLEAPDDSVLFEIEPMEEPETLGRIRESEWFSGNIFPDGSMLGTIQPGQSMPKATIQEFVL